MPPSSPRAASDVEMLSLDNQLCFALYSTSLAMTKLYKPVLERLALTYPQYLVMLALWQDEPLGVNELGARLFLDSGTLTPLLKRMQAAGLLRRDRDPDDERRVLVSLTPAGRALRKRAAGVPRELAGATRCGLAEIAELRQRLTALRGGIGASLADAAARAD